MSPPIDQRVGVGAGFDCAVAVRGGRAAVRQPGLRAAGGAGQEPVRRPYGAGPRPPGRLAAAAAVVEEVSKPGFGIREWGFGTAKACASLFTSQRQHRVSKPVTQRASGTQLATLLIFLIPNPESSRSEEHKSELQSPIRNSYADFS